MSTTRPVLVIGGPLDGNTYRLHYQPGQDIELNSAAGVCLYRFDQGQLVAYYLEPAHLARDADDQINAATRADNAPGRSDQDTS